MLSKTIGASVGYSKTIDNIVNASYYDLNVDNTTTLQQTSILKTRYIKSTNDLQLNSAGTKYLLDIGNYNFDTGNGSLFTLDKPFEFADTPGQTRIISLRGEILYTGATPLFEQSIGSSIVIRADNLVLVGTGSNDIFNLTYNGTPNPPVLVFAFCQFTNWSSVGSLDEFGIVVFNTLSCGNVSDGLTISNLSRYCILTDSIFFSDLSTLDFVAFNGATNINPTIQISGCNFVPENVGTSFLNIATNQQPNMIITACIFDTRLQTNAFFFNTSGLDQTSIYLLTRANKNVIESKIFCQSSFSASPPLITTINVQNQWTCIDFGTTTTETERVIFDETVPLATITSLEPETCKIGYNKTATSATGSGIEFETGFFKKNNNTSVVANNTTNTFTAAGHPFVNNDLVWFIDSTTPPTGVSVRVFYYVVNATANTFQVSNTLGGAALNFTSNGTNVGASTCDLIQNFARDEYVSGKSSSNGLSVYSTLTTGDEITIAARNISDTKNLSVTNFNFILKD